MPDAETRLPLPFLLERHNDFQFGRNVRGKTLKFEKCLVKAKLWYSEAIRSVDYKPV